ncbi:hypothetical protein [Cohnella sp.]|uniref:hypothetical protein n=1 Tax=Cohnella sp. TaxID=1883426 RepID=UPI0035672C86
MGKKRVRRRRRREFPKPDAAIVTLSSLVVLLLILWGGLHMREASQSKLAAAAAAEELGEPESQMAWQAALELSSEEENVESPEPEPDDTYATETENSYLPEGDEQASAPDSKGGSDEQLGRDETAKAGRESGAKSNQGTAAKPGTPVRSATGSEKAGTPKTPDSAEQAPAESEPPASASAQSPSDASKSAARPDTKETNVAGTKESAQPNEAPTIPAASGKRDYDQEIKEIQAQCTRGMKAALSEAESGLQQVDKRDPFAIQAWQSSLTKNMAAAESDCDGQFKELIRDAENDSVSPEAIEEWRKSFNAAKEELKAESNAKAAQLLGG